MLRSRWKTSFTPGKLSKLGPALADAAVSGSEVVALLGPVLRLAGGMLGFASEIRQAILMDSVRAALPHLRWVLEEDVPENERSLSKASNDLRNSSKRS